MKANSPVTMDDLVNGLKFIDNQNQEWGIIDRGGGAVYIAKDDDSLNTVSLSLDGLTVTFGNVSGGPTFTNFTFSA